jgi:hypothetical protein
MRDDARPFLRHRDMPTDPRHPPTLNYATQDPPLPAQENSNAGCLGAVGLIIGLLGSVTLLVAARIALALRSDTGWSGDASDDLFVLALTVLGLLCGFLAIRLVRRALLRDRAMQSEGPPRPPPSNRPDKPSMMR